MKTTVMQLDHWLAVLLLRWCAVYVSNDSQKTDTSRRHHGVICLFNLF